MRDPSADQADWADTCADDPPRTVPPLHPWDLRGQLTESERAHVEDIPITSQEYL